MISNTDLKHLRRCVELAKEALDKGDQPFGSVLVSGEGKVLFEDHNHIASGDNTQHPESRDRWWAANNMTKEERSKATVYTSGEHCPMCAAAHGWVGLGRIRLCEFIGTARPMVKRIRRAANTGTELADSRSDPRCRRRWPRS